MFRPHGKNGSETVDGMQGANLTNFALSAQEVRDKNLIIGMGSHTQEFLDAILGHPGSPDERQEILLCLVEEVEKMWPAFVEIDGRRYKFGVAIKPHVRTIQSALCKLAQLVKLHKTGIAKNLRRYTRPHWDFDLGRPK